MYTVNCPHCGSTLSVDRQVHQGKMRCRRCSKVFIGSTQPAAPAAGRPTAPEDPAAALAEAAAAGQQRSARPPALPRQKAAPQAARQAGGEGHVTIIRKQSPWPAVAMAIAGVAAIVAMIVIYNNVRRPAEIRDDQGNVVRTVPRDELSKAMKKPTAPPEQPEPAVMATDATAPRPDAPEQPRQDTPARRPPAAANDPALKVSVVPQPSELPDEGGVLIGELQNSHAHTIRSATISFRFFDASGRQVGAPSISLQWVAPHQVVRYSLEYSAQMAKTLEGGQFDHAATSVKADDNTVCWEIDTSMLDWRVEQGIVKLRGRTRNPTGQRVMNAFVWCDFFSSDLRYAGSAQGKLDESPTVGPSETVNFTVQFDPRTTRKVTADRICVFCLRLVGTK